MTQAVFETDRLRVRKAGVSDEDVDFFYQLWKNPQVMSFVGYPKGLEITREDVKQNIEKHAGSEFDGRLIIELKGSLKKIGECKMGMPDNEGIALTDIKLLPEYWQQGYGTEVKRGLVEYLFTHTNCSKIRATPSKNNTASQKMQEGAGAIRTGEGIYHFPDDMKEFTVDVPYYIYIIEREEWEKRKNEWEKVSAHGKSDD